MFSDGANPIQACRYSYLPVLLFSLLLAIGSGCRSARSTFDSRACVPLEVSADCGQDAAIDGYIDAVPREIESLVDFALQQSPALAESQSRITALEHQINEQLYLPDPTVNTVSHLAPVETAAGRQAFGVGIQQKWVDAERRGIQASVADASLQQELAKLKQAQIELAENVRRACYQILFLQKAIEITEQEGEALGQILEVLISEYEAQPTRSQQDLLDVQIEQSKLDNRLEELRQQEISNRARLNRLLHLPPDSVIQLAKNSWQLLASPAETNVQSLIDMALTNHPELQSQLAEIRRQRESIELAEAGFRPDLTIGLNWIATSSDGLSPVANGDDALLLGVGFNLPVRGRIREEVCAAQAEYLASNHRFHALTDRLSEEIFDTVSKIESTQITLGLLQDDIIPKTQRKLELGLEEFAAGTETNFQTLIVDWRSLLQSRIGEANLQSQLRQLAATLARQLGQLHPSGRFTESDTLSEPPEAGTEQPAQDEPAQDEPTRGRIE